MEMFLFCRIFKLQSRFLIDYFCPVSRQERNSFTVLLQFQYHSAPTTPSDNRSHTPHTDKDARSPVPSDVAAAAVVRSAAALLAGKVWKEVGTSDDDMDERSAMPSGKNVPIVAAVINSAAAFSDGDNYKVNKLSGTCSPSNYIHVPTPLSAILVVT